MAFDISEKIYWACALVISSTVFYSTARQPYVFFIIHPKTMREAYAYSLIVEIVFELFEANKTHTNF